MLADEWRQALADLCRQAAAADAEDQADFLRVARTLLAVSPDDQAHRFADLPSRAGFEILLAAQAWESAALALLPDTAGYLLSRSGDGVAIASLVLPECSEDVCAEASSPALAMVSALAGAIMAAVVTHAGGMPVRSGYGRDVPAADGFEIDEPWKLAPVLLH